MAFLDFIKTLFHDIICQKSPKINLVEWQRLKKSSALQRQGRYYIIKGLYHEMDLTFEDMHGFGRSQFLNF
jgi:hypothetical protein